MELMFLTTLFSGAELLVLGRVIESDLEVVCLVFFWVLSNGKLVGQVGKFAALFK